VTGVNVDTQRGIQRRDIRAIAAAALTGADAEAAVRRALARDGRHLLLRGEALPLGHNGRLFLVGAGKAARAMTRPVMDLFGDLVAGGVVVGAPGPEMRWPSLAQFEGSHPLPDQRSVAAATAARALLERVDAEDLVVVLLSGGASAMLEEPIAGVALDDLRCITAVLLTHGAPIHDLNLVRRRLSRVKGGGLAASASPGFVATLAVSDVVGDDASTIGSGPTVSAPGGDVIEILDRYAVSGAARRSIEAALAAAQPRPAGGVAEPRGRYVVVASVDDALLGAAECARELGYAVDIVSNGVAGEAREVGARWGRRAARAQGQVRRCLLAGGETTVSVIGPGRGGRNQELVLAAGMELEGSSGVSVAGLGTDGRDGPTGAAGAIADGATVRRARRQGKNPEGFLAANDSYTFFADLGDLLTTGPTGTNVMDLQIALAEPADD
jgi:glycerate-2-kinase